MRQSERDAQFARCLARVFSSGAALVAIGERVRFPSGTVTSCARVAEVDGGGRYDGAVLRVQEVGGLASTLALVTRALADGAPILLTAAARVSAGARLSALMTRVPPTVIALDALCGGLLRAGLETPRVHGDLPGCWLVSARRPAPREALDDFFAQPGDATSR